MTVQVTPLDATLGARLSNIQLRDLHDETWREVEDAFNEYAVLVFHDQYLTLEEQKAFGLRFGEFARSDSPSGGKSPGNGAPQGGLCAADHNDPNEQCLVMRSVGLSGLVGAGAGPSATHNASRTL